MFAVTAVAVAQCSARIFTYFVNRSCIFNSHNLFWTLADKGDCDLLPGSIYCVIYCRGVESPGRSNLSLMAYTIYAISHVARYFPEPQASSRTIRVIVFAIRRYPGRIVVIMVEDLWAVIAGDALFDCEDFSNI